MRLFLLFIILPNVLVAQMLDPKKGDPLSDKPFFDDEFVKWQHIKGLKGTFIFMLSDGSILSTNYSLGYEFDTLGRLNLQYETNKDDGTPDTTWNYYLYDEHSYLIEHRKCYQDYCSAYQAVWDENGFIKIKQELNYTVQNETEQVYRDSVITYQNDSLVIQKYFNNLGGYYFTEETHLDYMKRPILKSKHYFYSSEVWNEIYEYNEEGKLTGKKNYQGGNISSFEIINYTYDYDGNLIQQKFIKNEILIQETEFLYDEKGVLASIISQDNEQGKTTIIRFSEISFY